MVYKFKCLISDFTRRDDKDIRKSLHDLSQVKRTSSVKPAPMRAQHSIPIQAPQKDGTTAKTVLVKKFNKQMWRPPVGSPEGSDQRPFSPFGGTLPPSKINKKKVHEVFVWGEWRHLVKYTNPVGRGIFRFGLKSSLMCWTISQWLNEWFSFGRDFIMTFIHSMSISLFMDFLCSANATRVWYSNSVHPFMQWDVHLSCNNFNTDITGYIYIWILFHSWFLV